MKSDGTIYVLLAWALVSIIIFVLAVGFAGGFSEVFTIPSGGDAISIALWAIGWLLLICPFMLLAIIFVNRIFRSR